MNEGFEKGKYFIPVLAIIVIFLVMSLAVSPILRANPKDVPFAVLTLDAGAQGPTGEMNMGAEMVSRMTAGQSGAESPIQWSVLSSRGELDAALDANEYYGALVFSADFTAKQFAAAAGLGDAPEVEVIINHGKNVMLSTQMQAAITTMLQTLGLKTKVTLIHSADIGGGGMSALMGSQMLIMPLIMMIIAGSLLLFFFFRPKKGADISRKLKSFVSQLLYAAGLSLLIGFAAVIVVTWAGGLTLPVGGLVLFLWLASFCVMTILLGAFNIIAPLGALVAVTFFSCGLSSAMLAPEMMPDWYRNWIYPWVPQGFISEGIRTIIYMGEGAKNNAIGPLLIMGAIGLALFAIALLVPNRGSKVAEPAEAAETATPLKNEEVAEPTETKEIAEPTETTEPTVTKESTETESLESQEPAETES
ncbi:MAG: ABC transporter permease [Peptococcaceae bacterium]|nr:ABC transporter permease [Peptococcaceae bacterium]